MSKTQAKKKWWQLRKEQARNEEPPKESARAQPEENPSFTIWVHDPDPDEFFLSVLLARIRNEQPDQMPQLIRDMMDKKVPYKRIRFEKRRDVAEGQTYVTCIFER